MKINLLCVRALLSVIKNTEEIRITTHSCKVVKTVDFYIWNISTPLNCFIFTPLNWEVKVIYTKDVAVKVWRWHSSSTCELWNVPFGGFWNVKVLHFLTISLLWGVYKFFPVYLSPIAYYFFLILIWQEDIHCGCSFYSKNYSNWYIVIKVYFKLFLKFVWSTDIKIPIYINICFVSSWSVD